MNTEEIMKEYTDALYNKYKNIIGNPIYDSEPDETKQNNDIDAEKKELHKIGMKCLNKILTPELKVFLRNLIYNQLYYPDEPIFYKVFGQFPEVGDKVLVEDVKKRNDIDFNEFYKYVDAVDNCIWLFEGNIIEEEEIDGEKYFVITSLMENSDDIKEQGKNQKKTQSLLDFLKRKNIDLPSEIKNPLIENSNNLIDMNI